MSDILIPYGGGAGADLDLVTASAADVRRGKVFVDRNGNPITGNMAEKAAATYTPGTFDQTIAANQYLTGVQTIKGDPNLLAQYIKKGVTIFGVAGTWEGYVPNVGDWYYNGVNTFGFVTDGDSEYYGRFENGKISNGRSGSSDFIRLVARNKTLNLAAITSIVISGVYVDHPTDQTIDTVFSGKTTAGEQKKYEVKTNGLNPGSQFNIRIPINKEAVVLTGDISLRLTASGGLNIFYITRISTV